MVIAYHVTLSTYGFWLPNDPRGSGSIAVAAEHLQPFGPATKVTTRHSVAATRHDHHWRKLAKESLKYPEVFLNDDQVADVGKGFETQVAISNFVIYACCIQSQHIHLVISRHSYPIEQVARVLKQAATVQLQNEGRHPLMGFHQENGRTPSPWAKECWKVFLFTAADVERSIRYVEDNPLRHGMPIQRWPFVVPYVG